MTRAIVLRPGARFAADATAARIAGAPTVAYVEPDDERWDADLGSRLAALVADAYASSASLLAAAIAHVEAEDVAARTTGPLRLVWLGAIAEFFPPSPAIGAVFPIGPAGLLIGRAPSADVVLRQGPHSDSCSVARAHARVTIEDGAVRLRDLGSSRGVYVRGVRTPDTIVRPGDELAVVGALRLRLDGAPPSHP